MKACYLVKMNKNDDYVRNLDQIGNTMRKFGKNRIQNYQRLSFSKYGPKTGRENGLNTDGTNKISNAKYISKMYLVQSLICYISRKSPLQYSAGFCTLFHKQKVARRMSHAS